MESGVYVAPWLEDEADWEDPESAWNKAHLAGPLYSIYYHREGAVPMHPMLMVRGLIVDVVAATLAAGLLCCALPLRRGYLGRIAFVTALGLFTATDIKR